MSCSRLDLERDRRSRTGTGETRSPAGLKILIPGCAHWSWNQRARAGVLFGSYLVALCVGLFAWGTPVGVVVLAFAYGTHVASATDVIRQQAFPGFGRWVPMLSTSTGLGVAIYGPALALGSLTAWPVRDEDRGREGYLVNCRAYGEAIPQHGDWVWLRSSPWGQGRLGRVLAGPGQDVEWLEEQFRVDGERRSADLGRLALQWPGEMILTVPRDYALIAPVVRSSAAMPPGTAVLVPCEQILGRAWAQFYPILDRQLLR